MKSYMKHIKTPKKLLSFQSINIAQVLNIISSLKNSSTCAKDGVSSKMIKMIKESISPLILHLINAVIKQKKFPNNLKTTKILPTWKTNSNKTDLNNLRPINIIPVLSKMIGKNAFQTNNKSLTNK